MAIALDTNVLVALINRGDAHAHVAEQALENLPANEQIVICGAVYAELLAFRGRTEKFLDGFLSEIYVNVEWMLDEPIWRTAGHAFSRYAARRRKAGSGHPRRILTDFLIGAHAFDNGYSLLTLDDKLFRAAFPKLRLVGL
jgi:predicted nucleic acid-binding protein